MLWLSCPPAPPLPSPQLPSCVSPSSPVLQTNHSLSRPAPVPSIAPRGEEAGHKGPEGKGGGKLPRGAGGEVHPESVTSALRRASGPSACPLLDCISMAASCQEESDSSQDLDSPSAKAKDDCFTRRLVPASRTLAAAIRSLRISETPRRKDGSSPCLHSSRRVSISVSTHCHQGVADQGPPSGLGGSWSRHTRDGPIAPSLHMLCGEHGEPADLSTRAPVLPLRLWWRWVSCARPRS